VETEKRLAGFIAETGFADLPQEAINSIKNVVLNLTGATIAGAAQEGCEAIVRQVKDWGGKAESTVLVYGGKVPAYNAVLANAYMGRALDVDDSMFPGMHVGASTIATALAIGEKIGGCGGKDLITALVLGHEIAARMNSVAEYDGFDPTGISTVIGSAAVAGKLLNLNSEQMLNCLALAFNRSAGSFQSNIDGTLSIRAIQGFSAQSGVIAAELAKAGITGPLNFIEGVYGFLHLYGRDKHRAAEITGKLGQKYLFANNIVFKRHPSCACTEGGTDAILSIIQEHGITAQDVERIDIIVSPYAFKLVGHEFEMGVNPRSAAQFNVKYCVASALIRGRSSLKYFEVDQIKDPRITEMLSRIRIEADPALEGNIPLHLKTSMKVKTRDGKVFQRVYNEPRGAPGNPLTQKELQEMFYDYIDYSSHRIRPENVGKIISLTEHLEEAEDVRSLIFLTTPRK
jgi:2-methylcitrate dehydratase PrpD